MGRPTKPPEQIPEKSPHTAAPSSLYRLDEDQPHDSAPPVNLPTTARASFMGNQPNPDVTFYLHLGTLAPSPQTTHGDQPHVPPTKAHHPQFKLSSQGMGPKFQVEAPSDKTVYLHTDQPMPVDGVPVNPGPLGPTNQPLAQIPQPIVNLPNPNPSVVGRWNTDLFGCCQDDPGLALITLCLPCVTFGQIAEVIDEGQTSCVTHGLLYTAVLAVIGMPWLISYGYRSRLRSSYGLVETPAPDWLVHCFCELCALCQEYRELQKRDLNPALGWQGIQRQKSNQRMAAMTAPSPHIQMHRM